MKKALFLTLAINLILIACQVETPTTPKVITDIQTEYENYTITDGEYLTINVIHTPSDLPAPKYDLVVSDSEILSDRTINELMIRGRKPGCSKVEIFVVDNPELYASCTVTVVPLEVDSISLDYTEYEMEVGDEIELKYTLTPSDATYQDITWTVENDSIATINEDGKIIALNIGETIITARPVNSSVSAQCLIKVKPTPVTGIEITSSMSDILLGESYSINTIIYPYNATNQEVIWRSTNDEIVAVDSTGVITALGTGTELITAQTIDGGHSASILITVHEIDYFVTTRILGGTHLGSYTSYEINLDVKVTIDKYIDISWIILCDRNGYSVDWYGSVSNINKYTTPDYYTLDNPYGYYYMLCYKYGGKEYITYTYNI